MTAVTVALPAEVLADREPSVAGDLAELLPILNRLRFIAQTCRAQARLDLGTACAAIQASYEASLETAATLMVRVVNEALERRMTFLAPGSKSMSSDEEWLVRLIERALEHDTISVEFLLRRRVPRQNHHAFRSIIRVVAGLIDR
ncbi:MAG: hypothetical protein MK180_10385 [Rhodobacteraceae bacterium]|nr:hypothetical protein [Paracoccaceae bacterium]